MQSSVYRNNEPPSQCYGRAASQYHELLVEAVSKKLASTSLARHRLTTHDVNLEQAERLFYERFDRGELTDSHLRLFDFKYPDICSPRDMLPEHCLILYLHHRALMSNSVKDKYWLHIFLKLYSDDWTMVRAACEAYPANIGKAAISSRILNDLDKANYLLLKLGQRVFPWLGGVPRNNSNFVLRAISLDLCLLDDSSVALPDLPATRSLLQLHRGALAFGDLPAEWRRHDLFQTVALRRDPGNIHELAKTEWTLLSPEILRAKTIERLNSTRGMNSYANKDELDRQQDWLVESFVLSTFCAQLFNQVDS